MAFLLLLLVSLTACAVCLWLDYLLSADSVIAMFALFPASAFVILLVSFCASWGGHSTDLGTIRSSQVIVRVQQELRDSLLKTLDASGNNIKKGFIVADNDSPYATLYKQLANAEIDLAKAKGRVAEAKVSITTRGVGIFGFIVRWRGSE